MPRIVVGVGGSRSQSWIGANSNNNNNNNGTAVVIGSNTEALPVASSNVSIAIGSNGRSASMVEVGSSSSSLSGSYNRRSGKMPLRAASCVIPRPAAALFSDSNEQRLLPDRAPTKQPESQRVGGGGGKRFSYRAAETGRGDVLPTERAKPQSPQRRSVRTSFRASERGRGELLPTRSGEELPALRQAAMSMNIDGDDAFSPNRPRTQSSSNVNASRFMNRHNTTGTEQLSAMSQSLRNRRSTVQLDEEHNAGGGNTTHAVPIVEDTPIYGNGYHNNGRGVGGGVGASSMNRERGVKYTWSDTFGKQGGKAMRRTCTNVADANSLGIALLNMKRGHLVQACGMLLVTFFVWDSYHKAMSATEQMMRVRHDESMMMLHLKRLEEQSLHLHESITRLTEQGVGRVTDNGGHSDSVDEDLIKVQYGQLKQMEDELNHEVKSLQTKIQQTDRTNIVNAYGEGAVQVTFEIEFPDAKYTGSSKISFLLWYETPHAAWTLLHQVRRGLWDGIEFKMDRNLALVAEQHAPDKEKRLDFVEKAKRHESWTVGLTESDSGAISLFINLQDNTHYHSRDACIGKIVDGYDTLQRVTRAARDQSSDRPVRIKKATGAHMKRRDSSGLL